MSAFEARDVRNILTMLASYDTRIVTLVVGPEGREFSAHQAHLEHNSQIFRAAFQQHWREGKEARITLEEDEPEIVENYIHYCYTGHLPIRSEEEFQSLVGVDEYRNACSAEYKCLGMLFCFAEKHQDVRLKNFIVDAYLLRTSRNGPDGKRFFPTGMYNERQRLSRPTGLQFNLVRS